MRRGIAVAILILLMFAAGCGHAKKVKVTYRSSPPGGTLHKHNGEVWGPSPKVLWYDLDEEAIENGYVEAKGLIMRWPSGPEKRSGNLIRIKANGTDRRVVFTQPRIAATPAE